MYRISEDYEKMYLNITGNLSGYLKKNSGLKSLVLGLSGGIDSALTYALAYEALTEFPGVDLIGRSIPIETNKPDEIERGVLSGKSFSRGNDSFEIIDLTEIYKNLYGSLVSKERKGDESREEKIREGNIKARLRMIYLFDLAHKHNGMVLSTDNFTELQLGFWTLHGDVGNFGMLQYLWKTEVYGLSEFLAEKYKSNGESDRADSLFKAIEAVPTDGLGITSSDFEQIGVDDYKSADLILIDYLNGSKKYENHPVIKRYNGTHFKRVDPQNISREEII